MAEILELVRFLDEQKKTRSKDRQESGDLAAEVVIFPGVRVERQIVDLSARDQDVAGTIVAATVKKSGRKRPRAYPNEQK